jgi:hypothetical protein
MKAERQVERHAKIDEKRKERGFMPLLTKKQRKLLERAEMAHQQPCKSSNRRNRHRKDEQGEQGNVDELKAKTNTPLGRSRCNQAATNESEYSEDSELREDVVDLE